MLFYGNKTIMKKNLETIESVRNRIELLKGHDVKFQVNKGRKKIVSFNGKVIAIYPSVFTICADDGDEGQKTFSYTEILCGNVKVYPKAV